MYYSERNTSIIVPVLCLWLQVQIFSNVDALEASDLRLQVGAVGFVMDTQTVYINTQAGWREIRVGLSLR